MSIGGKPMVQWVFERAVASGADDVLIATDDPLILSAGHSFGSEVVMTAPTHARVPTGSRRLPVSTAGPRTRSS